MVPTGWFELTVILGALVVPVLAGIVVAVVAYWVIRKAVCAGILDAKKQLSENEDEKPTP